MAKPIGKQFKKVGVDLPPSVLAIVRAAGGEENMPKALASIMGAIPWLAVALYDALPSEEYRAFAGQAHANMRQVWEIVGAENVREAFDRELDRARRSVN
jgi:hypothetical protein